MNYLSLFSVRLTSAGGFFMPSDPVVPARRGERRGRGKPDPNVLQFSSLLLKSIRFVL